MKNKVMVGVPSGDLVQARFVSSLVGLLATSIPDTHVFYCNHISSRITENRNGLVKMAQEQGNTHILFIDSDMVFPPQGLGELLAHDKDIVGATACHRKEGEGKAIGIPVDMDKPFHVGTERLVKMQIMGLPFTLIRMSVFDKLRKPYFAEPFDDQGELVPEDNYFYINCARAGFDIWCDNALSMKMGHVGIKEYRITPAHEIPSLKIVEAA